MLIRTILLALVASLAFVGFTAVWISIAGRWFPRSRTDGVSEDQWNALIVEVETLRLEVQALLAADGIGLEPLEPPEIPDSLEADGFLEDHGDPAEGRRVN